MAIDSGSEDSNRDMPMVTTMAAMGIADIGIDKSDDHPDSASVTVEGLRKDSASMTKVLLPIRPPMAQNQPQPPPPQQPPPPPAPTQQHDQDGPTDSLSLVQLKRIVIDMPRFEPTTYAFQFEDTASFHDELNEWFSYADEEQELLQSAQAAFLDEWQIFNSGPFTGGHSSLWTKADGPTREAFVKQQVHGLNGSDLLQARKDLKSLLHLSLGVWDETRRENVEHVDFQSLAPDESNDHDKLGNISIQVDWVRNNASLICKSGGLQAIYDVLRQACLREWEEDSQLQDLMSKKTALSNVEVQELSDVLTLMYIIVEVGRVPADDGRSPEIRQAIVNLEPDLLSFLVELLARLRWDESTDLPLRRILLLFWKSTLLLLGGRRELAATKAATQESAGRTTDDEDSTRITTSPLDYHLFRQEITSKYPAYNPPQPLLPLESDNNSILPPLSTHSSRSNGAELPLGIGPAAVHGNGTSILHQPVHIATPAPSPPPSPVGPGGKAGKKQNYQTNQNFPFLYPPLDASSKKLGGKCSVELESSHIGKRWEGSDIPASILEAGELFASRMRMTRAMRQLWEEREQFCKFERGWEGLRYRERKDEMDQAVEEAKRAVNGLEIDSVSIGQGHLEKVEDFYQDSLPHLQSLIIVLLKVILSNVNALITQPSTISGPSNGSATSGAAPLNSARSNGEAKVRSESNAQSTSNLSSEARPLHQDITPAMVEDLDAARCREITAKAVSGVLLLLLKWFKVSHILKFEYMTQLLLDSNYLPLILKLFAHQDLDKIVELQLDRSDLSFLRLCRELANPTSPSSSAQSEENESEDETCAPPIARMRRTPPTAPSKASDSSSTESAAAIPLPAPEVDELGVPNNDLPSEPITNFSWRNFFSSINYLRIMQKICKNKAHRNLLLVQYKSSTILRKALKIPEPQLRLYTLKLFKNQVPYCGRKWRQSNMRVITAVYLYCRPELRDDWLAGSDVDAEVEEALPLEQALRALTHWHNLKHYPEQMGAETRLLEEEQDFFIRELEKMDLGEEAGLAPEDMVGDGGFWEGPLNMEGW